MCGRKHTILEWNVNILLVHNNLQLYILFAMYFSWTYAIFRLFSFLYYSKVFCMQLQ